ncbi:MAG: hypothetical protein ACLKAK_03105 [Alkaliphilus sp.]
MKNKFRIFFSLIFMFILIFSAVAYSGTYSRTITAWFSNIQVMLDGKNLPLENEPFIYDNVVYMPIIDLADALFMKVDYDADSNILHVDSNRLTIDNVDTAVPPFTLASRRELESLRTHIAQLENQIAFLTDDRFKYKTIESLSELEDYLEENFTQINDIPVSHQLRKLSDNRHRLIVTFNSQYKSEWESLDRREIENWIDDVFHVSRQLYNFDLELEGFFRDSATTSAEKYVSFLTRGNMLFFDFKIAEHKKNQLIDGVKLENALNSRLRFSINESFSYEVFVNNNDADLIVYFSRGNFDNWSFSRINSYLERLKREVERVYSHINVNGRVVCIDSNKTELTFSFVDGRIRSYDLLEKLEDYLNDKYETFRAGGDTFTFTYTVNESHGDTLEIVLVGDFDASDSDWQDVESYREDSFRIFVQNALKYVDNLWSVDIFGEVRDEDNTLICELDFDSDSRTLQDLIFE